MNLHVHESTTSLAVSSPQTPEIVSSLLFILGVSLIPLPPPNLASPAPCQWHCGGVGRTPWGWHCDGDVVSWKILQWPANEELGAALPVRRSSKHAFGQGRPGRGSPPLKLQYAAGTHVEWACDTRGVWAATSEYRLTTYWSASSILWHSIWLCCCTSADVSLNFSPEWLMLLVLENMVFFLQLVWQGFQCVNIKFELSREVHHAGQGRKQRLVGCWWLYSS